MNGSHLLEYGDRYPAPVAPFSFTLNACRNNEVHYQKLTQDLQQLCGEKWDWVSVVRNLGISLQMNKLEMAAWMQIIKKALIEETEANQLQAVQFSGYLAKSLLNQDRPIEQLGISDSVLLAQYQAWLCTHSHCKQISMRQLHLYFVELSLSARQDWKPTLNKVVDTIMQVDADIPRTISEAEACPRPREPVVVGKLRTEEFSGRNEFPIAPVMMLSNSLQ